MRQKNKVDFSTLNSIYFSVVCESDLFLLIFKLHHACFSFASLQSAL